MIYAHNIQRCATSTKETMARELTEVKWFLINMRCFFSSDTGASTWNASCYVLLQRSSDLPSTSSISYYQRNVGVLKMTQIL